MAANTGTYPVVFEVDTPERLSRWLWLVKSPLITPHYIVLWVLWAVFGVVAFFTWLAVMTTGHVPRGMFNMLLGVTRWSMRANAYAGLLTDKYPPFSTAEQSSYPVRLSAAYPERSDRVTAFFRWFLSIPHWVSLWALGLALVALTVVHVIVLVLTGKPNREIFRIIVGIERWNVRAIAYSFLLTDKYPPFSLD